MTDIRKQVEDYFTSKYPSLELDGRKCFILPNGVVARVDTITWDGEKNIVIEYADNMNLAKNGAFDDGDSYPPSAYQSIDDLIAELERECLNE